jgi:hypothetical protein
MLSELHTLNLKLCRKQCNKFFFHLIVVPQLSSGWQHNYSTKTWQAGCTNGQSIYSLMAMQNSICIAKRHWELYISHLINWPINGPVHPFLLWMLFCYWLPQKYRQVKQAHLFTLPACLVGPPSPCLCQLLALLFCWSGFFAN